MEEKEFGKFLSSPVYLLIVKIVVWVLGSSVSVWRPQKFRLTPKIPFICILRHMQL